jgi:hypothetical protein
MPDDHTQHDLDLKDWEGLDVPDAAFGEKGSTEEDDRPVEGEDK